MKKNVLVAGLGKTGKGAVEALKKQNEYSVYVYDDKLKDESIDMADLDGDLKFEFCIKSPGIKPDSPLVKKLEEKNIRIISDVEYFQEISACKNFIGVTGTNGKTTCVELITSILSKKEKTYLVGNVGESVFSAMDAQKDDWVVCELSSFQLEYTEHLRPKIALITNITKDHIDWHKNFENYKNAKYKIFQNMKNGDYLILNGEDAILSMIYTKKCGVYYFAKRDLGLPGVFVVKKDIIFRSFDFAEEKIMTTDEIKIPGGHNVENVLACVMVALAAGIDKQTIREAVSEFEGVEHRIEFVKDNGVKYYNDSKGTNPDSTIKALESFNSPIILLAGGYDKNSDFDLMMNSARGKVKKMLLMGATKNKLAQAAENAQIDYEFVENMQEAVKRAKELAKEGDIVLLSPACASWDMYKSYEERGKDFKDIVNKVV